MKKKTRAGNVLITLLFVGGLAGVATTVSAQIAIPSGATIDLATFSIFSDEPSGETVNLRRITADWGEDSVTWNSFNHNFDPAVIGSFYATFGWNAVDVTALVQAWLSGDVPNFGIFLEQGSTDFSRYYSSEYEFVDDRPKLEIWYTSQSGNTGYILIQRPGEAQDGVKDAYIWASTPDQNGFYKERLYTGLLNGFEKQSLIRFHFDIELEAPGAGTPGFWKNHANLWPVEVIDIGGISYTKAEAITILKKPVGLDMTRAIFKSLVAAKLNVMIGNDDSCIWPDIEAANAWLAVYPGGSGVEAGGLDSPWGEGEPTHLMLDDYNNGLLSCADHRM